MSPAKEDLTHGDPGTLRRCGGFSLLEIMVAIAVIMLASGIIMVNLEGLTPYERLRSAARNLAGMSDFVRSQATAARATCYLELDFDRNRYRFLREPPMDFFGRYIDLETGELMTEDEIKEWKDAFSWEDLPDDVYFRQLLYSHNHKYVDGVVTIPYDPTGTLRHFVLHIQGAAGSRREGPYFSVVVNGLTGRSEVVEGKVGFPRADARDFTAVMGPDAPGGQDR